MVSTDTARETSIDLVMLYLDEIGQYPLLTKDKEVLLAQLIEAGKAAEAKLALDSAAELSFEDQRKLRQDVIRGQRAHGDMVKANLRLAVTVAKRYQGRGMSLMDLIQEANLGLMHAVDKFEWRKGFKFSTYATWWIRQHVGRALVKDPVLRLTGPVDGKIRQLRQTEEALTGVLKRNPTSEELAHKLGWPLNLISELRAYDRGVTSLDTPLGDSGDDSLYDILDRNEPELVEQVIRNTSRDLITELLGRLPGPEAEILRMRFGIAGIGGREHPMTVNEIAVEYNTSPDRAQRQVRRAEEHLRQIAIKEGLWWGDND